MEKQATWWKVAVVTLALVATAATAYNIGWENATAGQQAQAELNALLNRSELETLALEDGPIYVTGHKYPDTDTVCSAIAYAELLQKLGYDALPTVLGEVNSETSYVLREAGVETPRELVDASGYNVVLVDHSNYKQSAEGLRDAHIISIIDHHGDGNVTTQSQLVYDSRPLGSTATIIWIRYRNYGFEPEPQTAKLMLGALLSDTLNLKSENTTSADREAVKALSARAGVADVDGFYQEMYKESITYKGMTDEEILFSDMKEYSSNGATYCIACVNAYDDESARDLAKRMKAVLPKAVASLGVDIGFAQVSIFHDDLSEVYFVPSNDVADSVAKEFLGDSATYDGTSYVVSPGFSRRKVTAPRIADVLAAHPLE